MSTWAWIGIGALALLLAVTIHDLTQKRRAILRNFPIIGHFRYWLEAVGPELRQYIVTSNDEERPFSRDQRRWIYASSKRENNYFGFGTDNEKGASENAMKAGAAIPATWTQRYEALRQYVLDGPQVLATPGLDLLLLLRKGVAAWMESWDPSACPPTAGPVSGRIPCPEPPGWQQQLTLLLAQMTTAHLPLITTP